MVQGETDFFPKSPQMFSKTNHMAKTNKQSAMWVTTAQLYPSWDTFEFDHGHVTNNQPINVLILLSESLAI